MNTSELKSKAPPGPESASGRGAGDARPGPSPRLLLKESSFALCQALSISQGQLRFDVRVDHNMREAELFQPPGLGADPLRTLLADAAPTLATLDCAGMNIPNLTRLIHPPGSGSEAHCSAPLARWTAAPERGPERYPSEGSSLLLAGMEREQPFGYVHLTTTVRRQPGNVYFCARVHRVSIHVPERATAYTTDLALATGVLAADLLVALYSSVPHATAISSDVRSDSASEPGVLVARQIHRSLARRVDHLNLQKRRPSVAVAMPSLQESFPKSHAASLPAC
ncbi:MAG TPA: hypothetical protein VF522_12655 [Ramlibacter sp.]|uniref:hypothetical protein n=1 Tax=Ramlibacter sp. TaxID=1917967 RepID=UPI002ED56028